MIKLVATLKGGRKALMLGLSADNMALLPHDKPIVVDLAEVGLAGGPLAEVVIFAGGTEEEMMDDVARAGLVGPQTDVRIDPRTVR